METTLGIPMKRRSRMRRMSTGKRLALTPRDLEIFKLLHRYRYLRSNFIHAFLGGNRTKLVERLGDLYHEGGLLDRPAQQWEAIDARYKPIVYENTERAESALHMYDPSSLDVCTWLSRRNEGIRRQFAHALFICELLASLELATRQADAIRLIPWSQIVAKAPATTRDRPTPFQIPVPNGNALLNGKKIRTSTSMVTPDAMFGLEYVDGLKRYYRFFALEADRGTMPVIRSAGGQSSYIDKLAAYQTILVNGVHRTYLGLPNLLVLTVTASERRLETMLQALQSNLEGDCLELLLFRSIAPEVLTGNAAGAIADLLTTPWRRAGRDTFEIGRI